MKKVLSLILCAAVLLVAIPLSPLPVEAAVEQTSGDYTYTVTDGEASITGYNGTGGDVTIPSTLDGYPVVSIERSAFASAFYKENLKSVIVPDSVTYIGEGAFHECSALYSIILPNSTIEIETSAFDHTAFYNNPANWENDVLYIGNHLVAARTTISGKCTIKNGTKTIANNAFDMAAYGYHSDLTGISIPDSVERIGVSAFRGCDKLTSVVIPGSVTYIGDAAFDNCIALTSVTVKNGVKRIGAWAFHSCKKLASITLPESVISIGNNAFYWTELYMNPANWENDVLYIGKFLIKAKSMLAGKYDVKAGTKIISDYAFDNCIGLTSITIPDGATSIGDYAFSGCSGLTSLTFPAGVTSIGDYAFSDCSSLTSFTIPASVTSIGKEAFPDDTLIRTPEDSYAYQYAVENDLEVYLTFIHAPPPPVIQGVNLTSVTLQAVNGYEYKCGDSSWQKSNVFTGLDSNKNYIFYQRIAETEDHVASGSSAGVSIVTPSPCTGCHGTGRIEEICDKCKGKGEITTGITGSPCPACNGDGMWCQRCGAPRKFEIGTYRCSVCGYNQFIACSACGGSGNEQIRSDCSNCTGGKIYSECTLCGGTGIQPYTKGDLNEDDSITDADAIYLLMHTFFSEDYPVGQDCDFNGDGAVTDADAIYLLMYTFFPEDYPIAKGV